MDINERLARRISTLRHERGLSIEELAARSGVSRAMISKIERSECSPTISVVSRLSIGLCVLLPAMLDAGDYREPRLQQRNPVASRRSQQEWRDPKSGYLRRTLTPSTAVQPLQPLQLAEIRLPAGVHITLENACGTASASGTASTYQQIWLLDGRLDIRLGDEMSHLKAGDCMAMTLDQPVTFANPGRREARYLAAVTKAVQ